jgi:hypothetical protein
MRSEARQQIYWLPPMADRTARFVFLLINGSRCFSMFNPWPKGQAFIIPGLSATG